MNIATITTKTGYTWKTSINGNLESVTKYFMQDGGFINIGQYPTEKMDKIVKIELEVKS